MARLCASPTATTSPQTASHTPSSGSTGRRNGNSNSRVMMAQPPAPASTTPVSAASEPQAEYSVSRMPRTCRVLAPSVFRRTASRARWRREAVNAPMRITSPLPIENKAMKRMARVTLAMRLSSVRCTRVRSRDDTPKVGAQRRVRGPGEQDEGLRRTPQHAWLEDDEEVRLKPRPAHLAEARHPGLHHHALHVPGDVIAQADAQRRRDILLEGDAGQVTVRPGGGPPGPRRQPLRAHECVAVGVAVFPPQHPGTAAMEGIRRQRIDGTAVYARDAGRDDRG